MKKDRFLLYSGISAVVLLSLAIISNILYYSDFEYRYRTSHFNRTLKEKEVIMQECLEGMKQIISGGDHHGSMPENEIFTVAEKNKITLLEFLDNKLTFWSDNNFDVQQRYDDSLYHKPIVFLQNGWFLPRTIEAGKEDVVALLRVRTDYSLKNDILRSGFEAEYGVPRNVGFSANVNASDFKIYDNSGKFLFCLIFPEVKEPTSFIMIPLFLWTSFFIIILLLFIEVMKRLAAGRKNMLAAGIAAIFCIGIYVLFITAGLPEIFYSTELFSPYRFSLGAIIPTLGHLVLMGILTLFFSLLFFQYFRLPVRGNNESSNIRYSAAVIFAGALLTGLYHYLFRQLIHGSNANYEPFRVLDLSFFSLAGYVSLLMLIAALVLILIRLIQPVKELKTGKMLLSALPGVLILPMLHWTDIYVGFPLVIFFFLLILIIWFAVRYTIRIFTSTVLFSILFGFYSVFFVTNYSEEKTVENVKIQAVAFSTENDPEAEQLLLDLWPVLTADSLLSGMMKADTFNRSREDVEKITSYLHDTYFRGYWANFNIDIVLCRNDDPLAVGPGNELFPNCFRFFEERIKRDGHKLTGTGFYFIDNQGGRSYYLGKLTFGSGAYTNGLFIELFADLNIFQPGYSALLLDNKFHGYAGLKDYSFAKYINGEIVLQNGDFTYMKDDAVYIEKVSDFRVFRSNGYKHVLFRNGNATVIISRPYINTGDILISFAYFFAFILLFAYIVVLTIRGPSMQGRIFLNFRLKMQLSYVIILLFSFILIGIVVSYLTISQYKTKHYENIKEKLTSVYMALDNRFSAEKHIDNDWSTENYASLNDFLISLSNTFNTDINLYDFTGRLIATSRPEIFFRNLTSTRINNTAYNMLRDLTTNEYYQKEKIGKLEYLSAYTPYFNEQDKFLAFINLPYFRMQNVLAKEISNLIVAVVNFTLLLILVAMSIAVFISDRLTSPLSMLGAGLASVELGKKTEHLSYKGNDEIGELVKQYNMMVDEIEESTHKLANSEREYAWREMARQIAHEIKNPLTPMKLNVQQLLKSWKDGIPDFDLKIRQFAANQIEYIDNLSSIASAFSTFAKTPLANPVEVNLLEQIRVIMDLFRDTENATFSITWPPEKKVVVFADKEHLNGIFSNLIKNGIQSVPAGRKVLITVTVEVRNDRVITAISDNGTGIPEDLQKKMFTPNFTTKSSGTGLGLSIVRKYVETARGKIWFESEKEKGTTFFVDLPLKYTVEKL